MNLTMRQLAPLFGVSKSAADRIIDHFGPMLALQPRKRFARGAVLIVDGTLVPTGNLGVNADLDTGFDIYFDAAAGTNHGFAAIGTGGSYRLYSVNLLAGKATDKGAFPKKYQVTDLALPVDQK